MPEKILNKLKAFGTPLMRSLLAQGAPSVLRGILLDYIGDIKIQDLQVLVEENRSLWSLLQPEHQIKIKNICSRIKDVRWLTAEWLITSSRDRISKIGVEDQRHRAEKAKLCALISYFLNSKNAYAWLETQTLIIRQEITANN